MTSKAMSHHSCLDFEIEQPRLAAALASASSIADKRAAGQPILADVLISVRGGVITAQSTDMHRSLTEELPGTVHKPGSVAVSASYLRNIVATLPAKTLRITGMDNFWLGIKVGRSEFKIMGHQPSDFPDLPASDKATFRPAPAAVLRDLIDKVEFSVSTDEARVNLNGALFELDGKRGTMVSTDGHRLTKYTADLALPKLEKGVIIPRRGLLDMRKMLERCGDSAELAIDGQHIFLRSAGGLTLSIKLNNVVFPPYEQVIPREHKRLVTVDRADLISTLHRALVMAPEKTATVRVALTPGQPALMQLTADNPDLGVCNEDVEIGMTGEPLTAGFNARYLLDVIESMSTKQVHIRFQGELDPCVVVPVDGPDYLGVVMPMRI
jgi:DNA polymerase-3 subunit beta